MTQSALKTFSILGVVLALTSSLVAAQPPTGQPPTPHPRARSPALALAVEAAQAAVATCAANGFKTTAIVVDSAAVPVVVLSGDGAPERTQTIGLGKALASIRFGLDSGEVAERAKTDADMAAQIAADPKIGQARRGALLMRAGPDIIGALSVSGAPGGDKDEVCTRAGLDRVASRLR